MRFRFWHAFFLFFYAALAVCAYLWLSANGKLAGFVPTGDFILMTLAIQRLTRLLTYDAITAFVRGWFAGADPDSLFGAFDTLVNCPWCTGLWFALVVVFFYYATPVIAWYAILVLALASLASLLQLFANYLGWSAQARRQQCENPGF